MVSRVNAAEMQVSGERLLLSRVNDAGKATEIEDAVNDASGLLSSPALD